MCVQAMLAEHSPNCLCIRYHTMPSPSGCLVEFLYLISDRGNIVVEFSYQADRPYKDLKKIQICKLFRVICTVKKIGECQWSPTEEFQRGNDRVFYGIVQIRVNVPIISKPNIQTAETYIQLHNSIIYYFLITSF